MGQKVHPIGLRLIKQLKWDNEWYAKNNRISSKLFYQSYQLKYFLISYLFNKEILVHSFSSKYIGNTLSIKINIVPTYNYYKYLILRFYKKYLLKIFNKRLYLFKFYIFYLKFSKKYKILIKKNKKSKKSIYAKKKKN